MRLLIAQVMSCSYLFWLAAATAADTATLHAGDSLIWNRDLARKALLSGTDLKVVVGDAHVSRIRISNAVIDESGKKFLASLRAKHIILEDANITDGDLALLLASSPECITIDVSGSDVTDASLPALIAHPKLRKCTMLNTAVTRQEVGKIRSHREGLMIILDAE